MKKLEIIEQICTHHPSYGKEKGWAEYTGGMVDTGRWFIRKMLDAPQSELKKFLDKLEKIQNTPPPVYSEQELRDMGTIKILKNGWISIHSEKQWGELHDELERSLFTGNMQ